MKIRNRVIISVAVLLSCLFAFTSYQEILVKPFPFLKVEYVSDISVWNVAPQDAKFDGSLLKEELREAGIVSPQGNFEDKVMWASDLARSLQRNSKGDKIRGMQNVFSNDPSYQSICSESSKIFVSAMLSVGVPARVVWMNGHTTSEAYNGQQWVLIDTFGNIRGFNALKKPLSLAEILQDYSDVTFVKVIDEKDSAPANYLEFGYLENDDNVYKMQNLALAISNQNIFDFHLKTRDPFAILQSSSGYDRVSVGQATQFVLDDNYKVGNFGIGLIERY